MSAIQRIPEPNGALAELHTDEPLPLVIGRLRAYGVTGAHVEVRGRRRWLVADTLPDIDDSGIADTPFDQPDDYPHTRRTDAEPEETLPAWILIVPAVLIVCLLVVTGLVL